MIKYKPKTLEKLKDRLKTHYNLYKITYTLVN